jgi:peroxiredoxin
MRLITTRLALTIAPALLISSSVLAQNPPAPLPVGSKAPAFRTTTLSGRPLSLRSLRGHVVLLDYWATWCGPCRMATPTLEKLYKEYRHRGLRVIGISVDDSHTASKVPAFARQMHMTYTLSANPADNTRAAQRYNATGIPSQFLIDKRGVIRWDQAGYSLNEGQELSAKIKKLLAEKA